ncbi:MAG TPA: CinA family nicotinamide mononucleotide deamidase-related protein [Lacibacter sp.]|nr:CinA family nicotinamide mononucleotide deamidase-related protein [Lacibacter sp.]HMO89599.1 CinA family nicotinamide mononucleotide deamidase-related protein [Lacibacter sp.]HMP86069.1 CinA family nicotinamide mononucleotide deamidase-related protein [Lacibacter sp.]
MSVKAVYASILTIGDELLIGQTIDTNSAWMAQELNRIGIWVRRRVAVGDVRRDIWQALDEELRESDIVLLTGGLGPTADDITKPLLADYFGGRLVMDEATRKHVQQIFKQLGRTLLERNLRQAEVPDCCEVLPNKRGTAPGMWFTPAAVAGRGTRVVVSMPGVPFEMRGIMRDSVLPRLKQTFQLPLILHRTLLTAGAGESFIAERLEPWEQTLPPHIKLAYLPNYGMVRLRLTATGSNQHTLQQELDYLFAELQQGVEDILVIAEDLPLEQALGNLLQQQGRTVATAESCTGGYLAHLLTSLPGASAWYLGSVVAYDNAVKTNLLQVQPTTLNTSGAVSEATVQEMLLGVLNHTGASYGIATSGIMGPDGGTAGKPVGTVWVAAGSREKMETRMFRYRFDRVRNIQLAAAHALLLLLRRVQEDHPA